MSDIEKDTEASNAIEPETAEAVKEEPAQEQAQESATEPIQEPAQESVPEPVQETAQEPEKEAAPVEKAAEAPAREPVTETAPARGPVEPRRPRDDRDGGYRPRRRDDDRDSDGRSDKGGYRGRGKVYFKRKVCRFCTQKVVADYKNPDLLRRFVTDRGKILPRRITGTCAKHQRELARQIKRARALAYLPYVKQ